MNPARKQQLHYRSFLSFLCVILLFLSCVFPMAAQAEGHASDAVRTVKVGFFAFDGYHMVSDTGRRSGYGYDFLQKIARYTNWRYEYVGYDKTWAQMQQMLEDGTIDMLTSAQKTPEREQQFDFSAESIGTSAAILTVKSGNTRYTAGKYDTYNGMVVGQLNHNSRNASLEKYAAEKGFTYQSKYFDDTDAMTQALQNGKVDALLTSNLRVISNEWILDQFNASDFYVMVKKGNTELLDQINEAIEQLDAYYPDWRSELWKKYYLVDSGEAIPFTAEEREYISALAASGQKLTAIVEPDRAPYSYFRNGEAKGIMPEIFARIEDLTGISFDIVEAKDRGDYFKLVTGEGHIDVRMDALADYYEAEQTGFKLTNSYLTTTISKVSGKAAASSEHVALTENGDLTELRNSLISGDVPLTYYPTITDCMNAVKSGRAAATYVYTYSAQQYLDTDATGSLIAIQLPQYEISYALGVAEDDDPRLISILDKAVNYVNGSITHEIILDQTKVPQHSLTFVEYVRANPFLLVGIMAVVALLLGLTVTLLYRQRTDRIIIEKNAELNRAIEQATKANQAKTAFLSSMSHDMRTPLNGIIGFTDFAMRTDDPQQKQKYLENVRISSSVLLSLINDTLDVSRIESGKVALNPEYVSAQMIFENLCLVIGSSAAQKNIQFIPQLKIADHLEVKVDKLKLQEIFMNLLSNAIKFTPDGGMVSFTVEELSVRGSWREFLFVVQDTGIGMSPEFQKQMYEPFAQEHSSQNGSGSGTGLGLYITKRFVDLMDGHISVRSQPGQGTVFTVLLSAECREIKPDAQAPAAPVYDFTGKCVMVVEDNVFNSEIAAKLLMFHGAKAVKAMNGRRAVDLFEDAPAGTFQAILMDIHMPVMGGYEATRLIRGLKKADAKTVPIIAMTADAYDEDVQNCLQAGMNGHIAKPIDTMRMFEELQHCMDQASADRKNSEERK